MKNLDKNAVETALKSLTDTLVSFTAQNNITRVDLRITGKASHLSGTIRAGRGGHEIQATYETQAVPAGALTEALEEKPKATRKRKVATTEAPTE